MNEIVVAILAFAGTVIVVYLLFTINEKTVSLFLRKPSFLLFDLYV